MNFLAGNRTRYGQFGGPSSGLTDPTRPMPVFMNINYEAESGWVFVAN
jgi:hypothetical protein